MRRNRKGGLNLSINAIVVLILAITMLGLGLAFMRNIFGAATEEFQEVGGTVKKQMIDQMKESNKVVDISRPKIEIKPGEKKQVFIGFKNEGNTPLNFQIRQVEASKLGDLDTNTNIIDIAVDATVADILTTGVCGMRGGTSNDFQPPSPDVYLEIKLGQTNVEKGDVVVVPMNVHTLSSASQGTCIYEIKVDTDAATVDTPDYNEIIELTVDVIS